MCPKIAVMSIPHMHTSKIVIEKFIGSSRDTSRSGLAILNKAEVL